MLMLTTLLPKTIHIIHVLTVHLARKPVLYLYPTTKTKIKVKLDFSGELTAIYPPMGDNTWNVVAEPDGTLTSLNNLNEKYKYLFWEGKVNKNSWRNFQDGFVIPTKEIAPFLKNSIFYLHSQSFLNFFGICT